MPGVGRIDGVNNLAIDAAPTIPNEQLSRPRVGFVSLGCPKNLVDSEVMMGMLAQDGATITADAATAPTRRELVNQNVTAAVHRFAQQTIN